MFGEAFLAESATKFDGSGGYYKGNLGSASSGKANTTISEPNPSLYIWSATNIFFTQKAARGVIVISPKPGQQLNGATTCKVVSSSSKGFGVHCDMHAALLGEAA